VSETSGISVVHRLYQAFISRDEATIYSLAGDNLEFHVPGRSPFAGLHKGKDQILRLFHETGRVAGRTILIEMHALVGGPNHVVGLHRLLGKRNGKVLDQNGCIVAHVQGGVMIDVWLVFEDLKAFDDFWS
jgi:ketosteroid isomerase-like protein